MERGGHSIDGIMKPLESPDQYNQLLGPGRRIVLSWGHRSKPLHCHAPTEALGI
uniref:Uncharacterized protein n=1 Tax=Arundo donax TaxID=35708 RepID=A0A0A9BJZ0_ARUDO